MMLGASALLVLAAAYDLKDFRGEQLQVEVDPHGQLHHATATNFKVDPVSIAEIQAKSDWKAAASKIPVPEHAVPSVLLQASAKASADEDEAGDEAIDQDQPASTYQWPEVIAGDYPYMCICDELGRCPL